MLKIKDNVSLKELEKFGFREDVENEWVKDYIDSKNFFIKYLDEFEDEFIFVDTNTREINLCSDVNNYNFVYSNALPTIFDLIQAGIVEKVVEDD